MATLTAKDIANYFLSQVCEECGDSISNLKLQKLVYYAQGFYLALHGKPLFKDEIRAWQHGPVVPLLYRKYSSYEANPIPRPKKVDLSIFTKAIRDFLDEVYNVFGQFSAWKLRDMTHSEPPWKNTPQNGIITHTSLKAYFITLLTKK